MSRIIAIANQKGGVGKTTTCVNLSAALSSLRKRVLLVDLDPQGNATMGAGVDKYALEHTVYDVLVDEVPAAEVIAEESANGCDVLPANADLTAAEVQLLDVDGRERRLEQALSPLSERYDYILIDCPPSLNVLTLNAFVAADSVLVPIQCEYYALEGLTALLETIDQIREAVNPRLEIEGLLRTMYDGRNNLGLEVSAQLTSHFGDQVFRTVVPRNVRLAEAPSHGMSIIQYDRGSRGALAYLALAGELVHTHNRLRDNEPDATPSADTSTNNEADNKPQRSDTTTQSDAQAVSGGASSGASIHTLSAARVSRQNQSEDGLGAEGAAAAPGGEAEVATDDALDATVASVNVELEDTGFDNDEDFDATVIDEETLRSARESVIESNEKALSTD